MQKAGWGGGGDAQLCGDAVCVMRDMKVAAPPNFDRNKDNRVRPSCDM